MLNGKDNRILILSGGLMSMSVHVCVVYSCTSPSK